MSALACQGFVDPNETAYPAHRRQGITTAILHAGARWAAARGAEKLYLRVMDDNHSARRLYGRVGFRASRTYHYRLKS
ncbi:GNAT family N-acetyltransferase [Streptomyces sp. OE57]|uniref:GNAT family N-acetyltransferase n=1 Tax=Streptomyces lacaronensis TaxID=3379885 RepID=UPI0039B72E9B